MSTSDHPDTDGQTERVNRILEEILRGYVKSFTDWSDFLPMVEFAINNSVHASTTHTPVFVYGLLHPRLPSQLECESGSGGGFARSQTRTGSCSSRVEVLNDASVADVDLIDIEVDNLSNSDDTIADPDEDDDTGIFTIANDYTREGDYTLAEEENDILAVRTRRTATTKIETAKEFLLAREAVVRFVQDSIAPSLTR